MVLILANIHLIDKTTVLTYYFHTLFLLPKKRFMRIEKIILAIVGVVAGLFVAGIAFYIYQTTRTISPTTIKTITLASPTPSAAPIPLVVQSPTDGQVSTSRIITVSGKTDPQATVVVTTDTTDNVVTPSASGDFSLSVTTSGGENRIVITAILPNGQEAQQTLTVGVQSNDF